MVLTRAGGEKRAAATKSSADDGAPPVRWCRERALSPTQIVYQPGAARDAYLIALGDRGQAVQVSASPAVRFGLSRQTIDVPVLMTPAANVSYVGQDRLPSPERVVTLLDTRQTEMSTSTWGEGRNSMIFGGGD